MDPLFVAFYTPSYKKHKERLEASLKRFALPYKCVEIEELGSWQKNSLFKAEFLLQCFEEAEGDLCYIDADAEVAGEPTLLKGLKEDVAFVFLMANQKTREILGGGSPYSHIDALKKQMQSKGSAFADYAPQLQSGLIFFKKCEAVHALLKKWVQLTKLEPHLPDGALFQKALQTSPVSILFLPLTYCYIPDIVGPLIVEPPVIVQHQASREFNNGLQSLS